MENPQVVIKYVSHGEKRYVGDLQQSSYSGYLSKHPFTDDKVQKFSLNDALRLVKKSLIASPFLIIQVLDATGKTYYDNSADRIIKEEVQHFLNEATLINDNNLKFVQAVNAEFHNFEPFTTEYDTDIITTKINVYWSLAFLANNDGVQKFNVEIERVEGMYNLQFFDKQTDELMQEAPKNIADTPWRFQVSEAVLKLGGGLYVMELDFDFKNNICEVIF